ncbi:hypothetical protein [Motilimonas pumila]|uniref:Uncharacterized protein n=1 Tax=Motilimonas pumila TaxID=2303987 RepID=A0A418YCP8_9GAMM|nr:hypothetical protein [Motilimonas pumila]RJG42299.1 hypothetical protein D1Z90_13540 [Motilimonas pumila]
MRMRKVTDSSWSQVARIAYWLAVMAIIGVVQKWIDSPDYGWLGIAAVAVVALPLYIFLTRQPGSNEIDYSQ